MALQRAPGVYFETTDPPPRVVSEVRTDVAGFVGVAGRGPLHEPVRVESWTQFLTRFGGPIPEAFLAYAVRGFFANGGRTCWVVRVGEPAPAALRASLLLVNDHDEPVFRVLARDPGPGSERISVRVEPAVDNRFHLHLGVDGEASEVWRDLQPLKRDDRRSPNARYVCSLVGTPADDGLRRDGLEDLLTGTRSGSVLVQVEDLAPDPDAPAEVRSRRPVGVRATRRPSVLGAPSAGRGSVIAAGPAARETRSRGLLGEERRGAPVLTDLGLDHFTGENQPPDRFWGLKALERVDEVALVAIPDLMWPGHVPPCPPAPPRRPCSVLRPAGPPEDPAPPGEGRPGLGLKGQRARQADGHRALLRHCETLRDRFALLDAPAGLKPDEVRLWVAGAPEVRTGAGPEDGPQLRSGAGQFGALYYPWVLAPEPLPGPSVRPVPPSGHVAGMFARVDLSAGVQKPPANEVLEEVRGVETEVGPEVHGWLNDEGVNVIRPFPGRGVRVFGARTLVPPNDPDLGFWRYVHVRRLVLMIEESIDRSARWLVFEPNRPEKWSEVDRVVRFFLDDLWRRGRLDGSTADEAFSVTCDDTTNPSVDVAAGKMTCVLGLRPPQPAEFVIVRLGRRVGETGVVLLGRPDDA